MLDDRGLAEIMLAYEIEAREQIDMMNRILVEASYAPQMLEAREAHVRSDAYWRSVLERATVATATGPLWAAKDLS